MKKLIFLIFLIFIIGLFIFKPQITGKTIVNVTSDNIISFCSKKPCDEFEINNKLLRINWEEFEELPLLLDETIYWPSNIINMTTWGLYRNGESYAHLNLDSFRGRDVSVIKPEGVKRIIFLGDSFTMGVKLNDSQIFDYLLEEDFNGEVEALNFGRAGYDAKSEIDLFFEQGLKYNPDLIIIFPYPNDWERYETTQNFWWINSNYLGLDIVESESFVRYHLMPSYNKYLLSQGLETLYQERIFQEYDRIKDHNVIFILFPFSKQEKYLIEYFKENNLDYYELKSMGYEYKSPWILDDLDWHPSIYAQKEIAKFLFPIVKERINITTR